MSAELVAALTAMLGVLTGTGAFRLAQLWLRARREERGDLVRLSGGEARQLRAWLTETRERLQACRDESAALRAEVRGLRDEVAATRAQCAQQRREIELLRDTLVKDYVRRPDTLPPRQG